MKQGIQISIAELLGHTWLCCITIYFLTVLLLAGCSGARQVSNTTKVYQAGENNTRVDNHSAILQRVPVNQPTVANTKTAPTTVHFSRTQLRKLAKRKRSNARLKSAVHKKYPVASKIVEHYNSSSNKQPGGDCLSASKNRFHKAYQAVYGHSLYTDLPEISTKYYSANLVFDHLYASTFGPHKGWKTLPRKFRARGGAGAIAHAGMGTLVDWFGIWSGALRPGAVMQVWRKKSDYKKVVRGIRKKDFDPFGHSFIFLGYEKDENGEVIGLRIADQGYQSYRPLVPTDYEVWWAVNLEI